MLAMRLPHPTHTAMAPRARRPRQISHPRPRVREMQPLSGRQSLTSHTPRGITPNLPKFHGTAGEGAAWCGGFKTLVLMVLGGGWGGFWWC